MSSPASHFRVGNSVTYVAIAAALAACVLTVGPESRRIAGCALAVAALADLYDGRFARLFRMNDEQKKFGVQIDSLSDVLSFGLAPVVVFSRILGASAPVIACGFGYVICAVTRLAYFNVRAEEGASGFIGVPTTVLGLAWSAWLLRAPEVTTTCLGLLVGGALMVAPIPIPRPGVKAFVVFTLLAVGLIAAHAWATITA